MPVTRHFLGWDAPLARTVGEYVWNLARGGAADFSDTLVVSPTRQSGRRLREYLARRADETAGAVLSLTVVTPAYLARDPAARAPDEASRTDVLAAWVSTLTAIDPARFGGLFPAPPPRDTAWTTGMARLLDGVRRELAEAGLSAEAVLGTLPDDFPERDRWRDLRDLERRYEQSLQAAGLRDPGRAQLAAAADREPPAGVRCVVLCGVADLTPLAERVLARWTEAIDIDVLVTAPAARAGDFDAWGRPAPARWASAQIDLPAGTGNLRPVSTPRAQAAEVVRVLAAETERFGPGDAALGVLDAEIAPELSRQLERLGLAVFDPAPRPLARHPVGRLADGFLACGEPRNLAAFGAFLRHPDVLERLAADGIDTAELLRAWDVYQNRHLPADADEVSVVSPAPGSGRPDDGRSEREHFARGLAWGRTHVTALRADGPAKALRDLLRDVYRDRHLARGRPRDDLFIAAATETDALLHETEALPDGGGRGGPARGALLRQRLREVLLTPDGTPGAVELAGWLELPWNDAPLLVVSGVNEENVPGGWSPDPFLPDSLRGKLGLRHDAAVCARDAFLLTAMIESRRARGRTVLVCGRVRTSGDPLRPSRLLLRCPDGELPARAARLLGAVPDPSGVYPFFRAFRLDPARAPVDPGAAARGLGATSFKAYLECPFRFYLARVLDMEPLDDRKIEPDALDFGTLVHEALEAWTRREAGGEKPDAARTGAFLEDAVVKAFRRRFGSRLPLTVQVALHSARQRLARAAFVLAAEREAGWEPVAQEAAYDMTLEGLRVTGRIDRLERHRETGRWRIVDFKTSDKRVDPRTSHLARSRGTTPAYAQTPDGAQRWTDLQLPVYRMLLAGTPAAAAELAYFNLPKAVTDVGVSPWADYGEALQASAASCAREVARRVAAGVFWPPAPGVAYDAFERLWQRGAGDAFLELPVPRRGGGEP